MNIRDWYESLFNPRPATPTPEPKRRGYDCPDCGTSVDIPCGGYWGYSDEHMLEAWIHDHQNGFHRMGWDRKEHAVTPRPGPDQTIEEVGAMEARAAFGHDHFYERRRTVIALEKKRDERGNLTGLNRVYRIQYTEGVPRTKENA